MIKETTPSLELILAADRAGASTIKVSHQTSPCVVCKTETHFVIVGDKKLVPVCSDACIDQHDSKTDGKEN